MAGSSDTNNIQTAPNSEHLRSVDEMMRDVTINSTVMYVIGFLVVYAIYYLSNSLIGHYWDVDNSLFYYGTDFSSYRGKWSRSSVVTIYGIGPVLCFLWAIVSLRMYYRTYKSPGLAKLFWVWGVVHGFIMFFGALAVGTFTKSGFGYALRWAYLPYVAMLVLASISIIVLLLFGIRFINYFMYTASSLELLDTDGNRKKFILGVIILPYVIGSVILLLMQMPNYLIGNILLVLCPGLVVIPMWARSKTHHGSYGIAAEPQYSVNKTLFLFAILTVLSIRVFLASGIKLIEDKKDEGVNQSVEVTQ